MSYVFFFLIIVSILAFFISLILAVIKPKLLMKKFSEKYKTRKYAFALTGLFFVSTIVFLFAFNAYLTPEEKAALQKQTEARQAAEAKIQAEKIAAEEQKLAEEKALKQKKAEEEQKRAEEEQKKAEAEKLQKIYDDQKEYEEWVPKELERRAQDAAGENFLSISVNKNLGKDPGAYIILIQTKASDGFSNNQARKGTWRMDTKIFSALYSSEISIASIKIVNNATLVDKYGNKSDEAVMMATVSQTLAQKIAWENFNSDNLPIVAEDYWIHPAMLR